MTVSLNQLEKAHAALQRAIAVYDRVLTGADIDLIETTRSGVIQNFEVVYEQSWKVLRRWELLGSDTNFAVVQSTTPCGGADGSANLGSDPKNSQESDLMQRRQLYRLAAKHGLLGDVEAWWDFHEARNMTSHTYNPPIALEVAAKARLFDTACGILINQLKELLGSDTNFAVVQSTTPSGQAEGLANLGSDPNNSHLAPAHMALVQTILADHVPKARVLAFGSRAAGTPRKYSDLDLAVIQPEPLTLRVISRLKTAFEDSDLPICVDVVDWNQADNEFKAMVTKQGMVELQH